MAEKINIASLSIDFDDVIKQSAKYKNEIDALKKAQKELDKTTEVGQLKFVQYEAELKNVKKSYRDNQSFASALSSVNKDLIKTMSSENKSTQELRDSRSQLNQISKQIKGDTEEELKLREDLNSAIDKQTLAIRNQGSNFNKAKDSIGEYKDNIKEAYSEMKKQKEALSSEVLLLEELRDEQEKGSEQWNFYNMQLNQTNTQINILVQNYGEMTKEQKKANNEMSASNTLSNIMSGNLKAISEDSKLAGGGSKFLQQNLKGATSGMWSFIKSSLAFVATPLGVFLGVVVASFLLVKNAMDRSEEATNKIKKAFSAFSGVVNLFKRALEPLGVFLIDGLVKGLEAVEKGINIAVGSIARGLDLLGFDKQAKSVRVFNKEIQEGAENAKKLSEAEAKLSKAQRLSTKLQLDYQKEAEKIRQQRDDESNSIAERMALNEKLGETLVKQLDEEMKIARQALENSKLRIQLEGATKETLDGQAEALEKIAEIEERMTSQKSEQLSNLNSLRKEASDKAKEIQDKAIEKMKEETELYISQQGIRKKELKEQLDFERKVVSRKIKILDAELGAKKISEENHAKQILDLKNSLLQKEADVVVDNARRELEAYNEANESKIDSAKYLSEAIFNEEKLRFERLAEQRRVFAQIQLDEGVISQQGYNDAINVINKDNEAFQRDLMNERIESEKERKNEELEERKERDAVDLENKLAITAENAENEFTARQEFIERERANELVQAEKTGADKILINKKYNAYEKTITKDVTDFKNQQNAEILSGLKSLFGEGSKLGKAFAIAEIASNTIQGATKAFTQASVFASNPITAPLAINAGIQGGLIVASGATQTAKIAGIKLAKGGILKGRLHSQGGIDIGNGYEAEDGESVINRKSTAMFAPLLSEINQAGGGDKLLANGGVLGGVLGGVNSLTTSFDYDRFALLLAGANKSLPNPVVSVMDITEVERKVNIVDSLSSL